MMKLGFPSRAAVARLAAVSAAVFLLSGCSWLQGLEIDETKDWTAQKLYSEARSAMNDGSWSTAKDYYTKLESRFPFGAYAQQAQVELAYVLYQDDNAAEAVQQLDRFLRAYPNHPLSPYALYLKSLAILNERNTSMFSELVNRQLADRDPNASRNAFDTLKELAERFPESAYAREAHRRMNELVIAQAKHELQTAKFYYDRKAYIAAINRAKVVLSDFQTTPQSDEAMVLIADCYKEMGLTDLEQDMRRVIALNQNREIRRR